jgi:hypothetical protein
MLFPNVHVMMGKEEFVAVVTSFMGDPYSVDSDSEVEFDKGEEDEDDIPTLDAALMLALVAESTDKTVACAEDPVLAEETIEKAASAPTPTAPDSPLPESEAGSTTQVRFLCG